MGTWNLSGGKRRPVRDVDNLNSICESVFFKNIETTISLDPMGFHGVLLEQLYIFIFCKNL
jgi:hypothetical protein